MDILRRFFSMSAEGGNGALPEYEAGYHPTSDELYDACDTPEFIRRHMFDVAAVADHLVELAKNKGKMIDREGVVQAALVHDVGNLAKAPVPALYQAAINTGRSETYYVNVRDLLVQKGYDTSDKMTDHLLQTLPSTWAPLRPSTWTLLTALGKYGVEGAERFPTLPGSVHDLEARILLAADGSVAPWGIVSVEVRAQELLSRPGAKKNLALVADMEIHKKNCEVLGKILGVPDLYTISLREVQNREKYRQVRL